jgi:hypothetical protein
MQTGLLWYDDDPQRTLEAKISRAAQRYREKYGRLPDTCYVHPQVMAGGTGNDRAVGLSDAGNGSVRVVSAPYVLLNHFWLGEGTAS